MKNIRYILLISACCLLPNAGKAEINLTFDVSNIISSNTTLHTHHTPVELKPISISNSSVKLAAVCALGGGGCSQGFGLNDIGNNDDIGFDSIEVCVKEGFTINTYDNFSRPINICPYNPQYFEFLCSIKYEVEPEGNCSGDLVKSNIINPNDECHGMTYCTCNPSLYPDTSCKDGMVIDKICNYSYKESTSSINSFSRYSCKCPDSYFECSDDNQIGVGTPCIADGVTRYPSCKCPDGWSTCSDVGGAVGALKCVNNGTNYFNSCHSKSCAEENSRCTGGSLNLDFYYANQALKCLMK